MRYSELFESAGFEDFIVDRIRHHDALERLLSVATTIKAIVGEPPGAKLTETTIPTLYHGSRRRFPKGFVLLPQSKGYVSWDEVRVHEQFIERYRPRDCLSRGQSVFMVADPRLAETAGGYEDYVYEVRPVGKVERNDLNWYEVLNVLDNYSIEEQEQIDLNDPEWIAAAKNYWKGVPHPGRSMWEYRSPSAVIIRRVKL
jgi:hypothetical protein